MEQFLEQSVERGRKALPIVSYWFFLISMGVFGLLALVGISQLVTGEFNTETLLFSALFTMMAFYCYKMKDMLRIEFEYIFTDGEMDFDKVIAGKKRQHIITLRPDEIHEIGLVDSPGYQSIKMMGGYSRLKLSLNKDKPLYFMHFTKKGRRGLMTFEPNERMVEALRERMPDLFKEQA